MEEYDDMDWWVLLESVNVSDDGRVSGKKEPKLTKKMEMTTLRKPHSMTQTKPFF